MKKDVVSFWDLAGFRFRLAIRKKFYEIRSSSRFVPFRKYIGKLKLQTWERSIVIYNALPVSHTIFKHIGGLAVCLR